MKEMSQIIVDMKSTTENPAEFFFFMETCTFSTPTLRRAPSDYVSHQWVTPQKWFQEPFVYFVLFDFHSVLSIYLAYNLLQPNLSVRTTVNYGQFKWSQ